MVLSRMVEVVVEGSQEEIHELNEDIPYTAGWLVCRREPGNTTVQRCPLGAEWISNTDLRNYSLKGATISLD